MTVLKGSFFFDLYRALTRAAIGGHAVNVVADLVGHEKASFTIARYGHALPKQTKEAVATVESVLFKKTG